MMDKQILQKIKKPVINEVTGLFLLPLLFYSRTHLRKI